MTLVSKTAPWIAVALAPLLLAGCGEITRQDVSDARDAVIEEREETEEARRDAVENVREEERETEEARRDALKPVIEDAAIDRVREEEKETEEARDAGRERVREEVKETREAEKKALETEAKFNAQEARDAYVKSAESQLKVADERIDQLRDQGADLEGPAKEENTAQIVELQRRRDRVKEALSEINSAELLTWQEYRGEADRAMRDLAQELDEAELDEAE